MCSRLGRNFPTATFDPEPSALAQRPVKGPTDLVGPVVGSVLQKEALLAGKRDLVSFQVMSSPEFRTEFCSSAPSLRFARADHHFARAEVQGDRCSTARSASIGQDPKIQLIPSG